MYNAKIVTTAGATVNFGYDAGIIFDIDPLSGVTVSIGTSQGFQQIGETVDTQSVSGVSRTIEGTIVKGGEATARTLLRRLPIMTSGKLYYNDKYYCDIVVSKTPYVVKDKNGVITFSMMVYSPTPYWYDVISNELVIGTWSKEFMLPVVYDSHRFGTRQAPTFVNCYNSSPVDIDYEVTFTTDAAIENFGLQNIYTYEKLQIDGMLDIDDVLVFKRENGRLILTCNGEDAFAMLTEDSNLFYLHPGDNALAIIGDDDVKAHITVSIAYRAVELGVI